MVIRPGAFLAEKYRVTRMLGRGSMGEVWEATHTLTERRVALKVLADDARNVEARARILREARACGRIQHRNVIEVFDVGETDDGRPYLVMPLLSGETLEQRLEAQGPLPEPAAVAVTLAVARALSAAHALGIVHRDLKPGNVFLHDDGGADGPEVKVLDFGISKILSRDEAAFTDAGRAVGSPAYMSPEQARGVPDVDARTDVWALGILLFEALTNALPFPGETPYAIVGHILHGAMPDIDALLPDARPSVRDLLKRCIVRDRDQRVLSARDVAGWLEAALAEPGAAAPSGPRAHASGPLAPSPTSGPRAPSPAEPAAPPGLERGAPARAVPAPVRPHAAVTATASAVVTQKLDVARASRRSPRSAWLLPMAAVGLVVVTAGGVFFASRGVSQGGSARGALPEEPQVVVVERAPEAPTDVASGASTAPDEAPRAAATVEPSASSTPSAAPTAPAPPRPAREAPRPARTAGPKSRLPDSPG